MGRSEGDCISTVRNLRVCLLGPSPNRVATAKVQIMANPGYSWQQNRRLLTKARRVVLRQTQAISTWLRGCLGCLVRCPFDPEQMLAASKPTRMPSIRPQKYFLPVSCHTMFASIAALPDENDRQQVLVTGRGCSFSCCGCHCSTMISATNRFAALPLRQKCLALGWKAKLP